MRFVSTRGAAPVSFKSALFEGLAPDGGLYVPERIDRLWDDEALAALPSWSLVEIGARVMSPFVRGDLDDQTTASIVASALSFEIPLIEIEPGIFALELFHGPTQAFKDVGARVMARLMAALHEGGAPLTVLVATSGDTGGAVAHAFHEVPHTRVVILYPHGRVSPTQEAQLTMFNGVDTNVRAYAVEGSFDDCQRLTKEAFADADLRQQVRLTSANSINIGRLLPQMIYYAHAVAQLRRTGGAQKPAPFVSTPSGNFGNLTAGLMQKHAGLPVERFVAATNVNDIVPAYLDTGIFQARASIHTLANAMDVGNPSNFDRIMWLYGGDVGAVRRDVAGSAHKDDEVVATIRRVYEERGYVLDPHSAIGYLGIKGQVGQVGQVGQLGQVGQVGQAESVGHVGAMGQTGQVGRVGIFLATAHPAKFGEIVEPILGRAVPKPQPLLDALARERHVMHIEATLEAVGEVVRG